MDNYGADLPPAAGYPPQQQQQLQYQPAYPPQQQQQHQQPKNPWNAQGPHQPQDRAVTLQPMTVGVTSQPPDHTGPAMMVTLCCFWPTGIMAISHARDAKTRWERGDIQGAYASAEKAKNMVRVSIIAGICTFLAVVIVVVVYVGVVLKKDNDNEYHVYQNY